MIFKRRKIGYKVVKINKHYKHPKVYYSCVARKESRVIYMFGKKIKRPVKCGPLAVFNDHGSALHFKQQTLGLLRGRYAIIKVKYKQSKTRCLYHIEKTEWSNKYTKHLSLTNLPYGTDFADWLKLIEVV